MERTRATAPALLEESALPGPGSLESGPRVLPLREWVETVRSPGVMLGDVEGLLASLSGPLAEGESPRERADQLLRLLQDEALGELSGKDGRQVRPAALEALLALGYPYALEVPPEALERMRRVLPPRALSRASRWGVRLAALGALVPTVMMVFTGTGDWWRRADGLVVLTGLLFLPAVLSAIAERYRFRWLKFLANGALGLWGAFALFFSLVLAGPSPTDASGNLGLGLLMLASAICLRHRDELED